MRVPTLLTVFFVAVNSWALMMQASGFAATVGLAGVNQECPQNPTDAQIQTIPDCAFETNVQQDEIEAGSATGSTLFGMYQVVVRQVMNVLYYLPALNILARAGVPGSLIGFMTDIFGLLSTITALSYLRGYDL